MVDLSVFDPVIVRMRQWLRVDVVQSECMVAVAGHTIIRCGQRVLDASWSQRQASTSGLEQIKY
jgi:hypothetical protein